MTKGEINAYLGVLKAIAKSNKLETLKGLAVKDGNLEATNLDFSATLKAEIKAEGIYDPAIADLLKIGMALSVDMDAYKRNDIRDWLEIHPQEYGAGINLATSTDHGTLADIIIHASDFVSTDVTRSVLQRVWLTDGEIMASDGFRALLSGKVISSDHKCALHSAFVKQFKKVAKYGVWKLQYNDDFVKLSNGVFTMVTKNGSGSFPDLRAIFASCAHYTHTIKLPYTSIKAITNKTARELQIKLDGSLLLDARPLPFKAELSETAHDIEPNKYQTVLCGLKDGLLKVNPNYLVAFKPQPNGNIVMYARLSQNKNDMVFTIDEP